MSRGRRYDTEPKLNMKKVFAVFIAIIVIIMFVFIIKGLLTKQDSSNGKITSETYFVSFKDNKWGVINSSGENVIDPSYAEMITIPDNKTDVFICTYDVDYTTGDYKTKVLNGQNQTIFTDYEKVEAIQNNDKNNNLWYEQNVLKVKQSGKYGLINLEGKQILPIEYDEITPISGIKNSLKVKKEDKCGIVNNEGKIVIEPKYSDIDVLGKDNKSGFIVKNENGKFGIVDYSNDIVLEAEYDSIKKVYGNDLYVVTLNGKDKLVNKEKEDVLTKDFDTISQILNAQENGVVFKKSNKYGVVKISGEIVINAEYDSLEEAKVGNFIAKKGDKYGIIDIENNEKLSFNYTSIVYNEKADLYVAEDESFNSYILDNELNVKITGMMIELNESKGYIKLRIDNEYKYYDFKFEEKNESDIFTNRSLFLDKKNGKYGFVNKSGNMVVDYIYDDATEQNDCGYVGVKQDGKWGCIDSKGNVVQEPIYNLDEYLVVDFIGRWHLGMDINMNYYNQL